MMASGEIRLSIMTMRQMPVLAQSQMSDPNVGASQGQASPLGAFPLGGVSIDEISEVIVTANVVGGVPPGQIAPPDSVPNGPWEWNPNPQNPRGGNWMGPKQPRGGRWTITHSPATPDQRGYWKSNGPDGSNQWFDENGNPMTPDQKQWGPGEQPPNDWLPALPFTVPSTNPWWWLLFSAP